MVQVTGALYAIRTADIPDIPESTILDDVYIPLTMAVKGRRIVLAEEAGCVDAPTKSAGGEFIRKVRTLAGLIQLCHLVENCLNPRVNAVWGRFLIHKLLRLASPYGLALVFIGSLIGRGRFYVVSLDSMLVLMVAAVFACLGAPGTLFRIVRWLVTLQAAAVWAFPSYYFGWTSVMWTRVETDRGV